MNAHRVQQLVVQLQVEIGQRVTGNGSLTLHFQHGRVEAVELKTHTRIDQASAGSRPALDSPAISR